MIELYCSSEMPHSLIDIASGANDLMCISLSERQFVKAPLLILITVFGISMLVRELQSEKAQNLDNHDYMIVMIEKWRGGG